MKSGWIPVLLLLVTNIALTACAPLIIGGAAATTATVVTDRRTTGSFVEDESIELRINSAISDVPGMSSQTHINVTSYNGIVLLSGEAPSEALRARAGDIANSSKKVRRVHNEITIAAPSSLMTRSSDTLITSKVKTSLFQVKIKGFNPSRVKVVTENGTVFLMGILSRAEGEAATNVSRGVSGVQRIVKLFEYTS